MTTNDESPLVHALSVYPVARQILRHLNLGDTTRLYEACDPPVNSLARQHLYRHIVGHHFDKTTKTKTKTKTTLKHLLETEALIRQALPINHCPLLLCSDSPLVPSSRFCRECITLRDTIFDTFAQVYASTAASRLRGIVAQSNRSFETHLLGLRHRACRHERVNPRLLGTIRLYEEEESMFACWSDEQRSLFHGRWARRMMDELAERFEDVLADQVCVRINLRGRIARCTIDWSGRSEVYAVILQYCSPEQLVDGSLTFDFAACSTLASDVRISRTATRPYDSNGSRLLDHDIALVVCQPVTDLRWCGVGDDGVERFIATLLRETNRRGGHFVHFYTLGGGSEVDDTFVVQNQARRPPSRNPYRCFELALFCDRVNLYPFVLIDDPDLSDDDE